MRPEDRIGKCVHRRMQQDRHQHAAAGIVEYPRVDDGHSRDPDDVGGNVGDAGHSPLPAEPDRHVPAGPEHTQDQARLHRSVERLQMGQRIATPAHFLAQRAAGDQCRPDEEHRVGQQLRHDVHRRGGCPDPRQDDRADGLEQRQADEDEQVPEDPDAPLYDPAQQPIYARPPLGKGGDDERGRGRPQGSGDAGRHGEAHRRRERQNPAAVPRQHEKPFHEPGHGVGDHEIRDQRMLTDQAAISRRSGNYLVD